ncbi:MAG: hypothetical protein WC494_00085 [Candidatus Pacearchaeota archaeon]
MKLKRVMMIFLFGFLLFSIIPNVSADPVNEIARSLSEIISGAYEVIEKPLEILVGDSSSSEWFMARVLFLLIIFSLVWVILDKLPFFEDYKNRWALWIVAISVSILSIRWIGETEVVQSILLPYSTLGVAMTAGLPFILFFLFVKDFSTPIRKVSWIFFAVIFLGLWYVRLDQLNLVGFASYIYLVTAIAALLMFSLDGTIQNWRKQIKDSERKESMNVENRARIMRAEHQLNEDVMNNPSYINTQDYKTRHDNIERLKRKYGMK